MNRILRARLAALCASVALAGCAAPMQIFSSASDAASRVTRLTWFMIVTAAIVYVIVMAAMFVGIARRRDRSPESVDMSERSIKPVLIGGVALPALILAAVFVVAESAMGSYPYPKYGLTVRVAANQWWWDLNYDFPQLAASFRTANELHIPVNVPVRLLLGSNDVIHSFWVPQLQGKMDVIPGQTNELRLVARRPGVYVGVCEEFCGAQHANMGIRVIADDSATFAKWATTQLADAAPPTDSTLLMGQRLFVGGPCALCHSVRGTPALGQVAPDLTHVGSRLTLAAGTLPNTVGSLEAWITNAQAIKPGAKMPSLNVYSGEQLRAVAAYLESLK